MKSKKDKIFMLPCDSRMWEVSKLIVLAGAVGVVAGLGAIAFHGLCHIVSHYALAHGAGYHPDGPAGEMKILDKLVPPVHTHLIPLMLLVIPTIGGLISGVLIYTLAPEAEGHGTDAAIDAYHNKRGIIRARVPILKLIASAITLGTGGSGGREGPIAQIGAGFGSFLATKLKLPDRERRILLAAGVGAGIGAIFHAPLAGAIFAIEVLYRDPDFEADALIPSFISTTVAYSVFGLVFGFHPLFVVGPVSFNNPMLLLPLAVLAGVMVFASLGYVKCFYGLHDLFQKLKIPNHLKPAIGAFATGVIALAAYYVLKGFGSDVQDDGLSVLSFGYGFLQKLLVMDIPSGMTGAIILLLIVGLGKILTTSLTIGSGGSGGVFGPSMVIGGALGGLVGILFHHWMPHVVTRVDVFVILGMASFFAAAANTPVSTLIMVSEMTASYMLLLPSMWVCALAYILSGRWSIYREQVNSRIDSPAHKGDLIVDILEELSVRDAWKAKRAVKTIPAHTLLSNMESIITDSTQNCFPVVNEDGTYYGIFSLNDIRKYLYNSEFAVLANAQDLASTSPNPLFLDTNLSSAMGQFAHSKLDELPIIDPKTNHVIGALRRRDIIAEYSARLIKMKTPS